MTYIDYDSHKLLDSKCDYLTDTIMDTIYYCDEGDCEPIDLELLSNTYLIYNKIYSLSNENNGKISIKYLNMTDIKAFKFLDIDYEDSPGILITDDEYSNDLSSILSYTKLYYCKNNTCDETTGYIKLSNNEVYYCDSKYCSELQDVVECNDNHTNNIGKAFYDSSDDKFKICVNNGNSSSNNFRLRTISSSNKNYIFNLVNKNSLLYRLYISDKGGNIIGLSTT
eukprot:jgi/Orpsp1_1/1180262/evm.model.c7180000072711.1